MAAVAFAALGAGGGVGISMCLASAKKRSLL